MLRLIHRSRRAAALLWRGLREWSGDAAYESYLRRVTRADAPESSRQLSASEFYVQSLERKYGRVSRCC